jgi:hypothetical protein
MSPRVIVAVALLAALVGACNRSAPPSPPAPAEPAPAPAAEAPAPAAAPAVAPAPAPAPTAAAAPAAAPAAAAPAAEPAAAPPAPKPAVHAAPSCGKVVDHIASLNPPKFRGPSERKLWNAMCSMMKPGERSCVVAAKSMGAMKKCLPKRRLR